MSKDKKPQCSFIQRFAEDLTLTGKSERTVQSNCRALRKLSEHPGHDPNQASEDDVRKYLLFVTEERKSIQPRSDAYKQIQLLHRTEHAKPEVIL